MNSIQNARLNDIIIFRTVDAGAGSEVCTNPYGASAYSASALGLDGAAQVGARPATCCCCGGKRCLRCGGSCTLCLGLRERGCTQPVPSQSGWRALQQRGYQRVRLCMHRARCRERVACGGESSDRKRRWLVRSGRREWREHRRIAPLNPLFHFDSVGGGERECAFVVLVAPYPDGSAWDVRAVSPMGGGGSWYAAGASLSTNGLPL